MLHTLLVLGIVFITSFLSILCIIVFSRHFKLFDLIDERKIHTGNIPRLGGIGIFIGFLLGLIIFFEFTLIPFSNKNTIWSFIIACGMIFIMGVWDDMKPWRARYKMLIQCTSAVLILFSGYSFSTIRFEPFSFYWNLGIIKYPITFLWIIGVTNAVNFIDGIDGLAGSIVSISTLTYACIFYLSGNYSAALVCIILTVSIFGFLVLNFPFPKAKIFMGDGGSQFLGFTLAVLPLLKNSSNSVTIDLPYAAAILLIPIFDTFAAIWRRIREKRSIDSPDRLHLHHKLMLMGLNSRQVLLFIIFFQLIISVIIICSFVSKSTMSVILLFTVYLIGLLFFSIIHIKKKELLVEINISS